MSYLQGPSHQGSHFLQRYWRLNKSSFLITISAVFDTPGPIFFCSLPFEFIDWHSTTLAKNFLFHTVGFVVKYHAYRDKYDEPDQAWK
jgi:hypothetical protein